MKKGTLSEQYLTKSVLFHVKKKKSEIGAALGNDYAIIGDLVSADGFGKEPEIAWVKAMNNFACSGGTPIAVRLLLQLPEATKDSEIKRIMARFQELAQAYDVEIIGGHSEIIGDILQNADVCATPRGEREAQKRQAGAHFYVTVLGTTGKFRPDKRRIKPGARIVMIGQIGLLGSYLLAQSDALGIGEHFTKEFLEQALPADIGKLSILDVTRELLGSVQGTDSGEAPEGIYYIHDISSTGVYGALWQLGKWADCGFIVENDAIPIKQHTIEICEYFNCNPYLIDGTGGLLLVCNEQRAQKIMNLICEARIIGTITEDAERRVLFGDEEYRTLAPQ